MNEFVLWQSYLSNKIPPTLAPSNAYAACVKNNQLIISSPWWTKWLNSINVGPKMAIVVPNEKKQPQYNTVMNARRGKQVTRPLALERKLLESLLPFAALSWAIVKPRRCTKLITCFPLHVWRKRAFKLSVTKAYLQPSEWNLMFSARVTTHSVQFLSLSSRFSQLFKA